MRLETCLGQPHLKKIKQSPASGAEPRDAHHRQGLRSRRAARGYCVPAVRGSGPPPGARRRRRLPRAASPGRVPAQPTRGASPWARQPATRRSASRHAGALGQRPRPDFEAVPQVEGVGTGGSSRPSPALTCRAATSAPLRRRASGSAARSQSARSGTAAHARLSERGGRGACWGR